LAEVSGGIRISQPSHIRFAAPPELVVIPETNVYAAPDVEEDLYFYGGWWWRPWEGQWYRSRNYNSGWRYYKKVPSFYENITYSWRNDYREHNWKGHQWDHQRVSNQQAQANWKTWEKDRYWEKQHTWGVQGLRPETQSNKRPKPQKINDR
jgi:hypothetical protein